MSNTISVSALVVRWQELRQQGQDVSAKELCAGCPELLDDVKRQIQALASMEQFLAPTFADLPRASGEKGAPQTHPCIPGYELLGEIASGGMGVVLRVRDPDL